MFIKVRPNNSKYYSHVEDDEYYKFNSAEAMYIIELYDTFKKTGGVGDECVKITERKHYTSSGVFYEYVFNYDQSCQTGKLKDYAFLDGVILSKDQISDIRTILFSLGMIPSTTPAKEDAIDPYVALVKIAKELYLVTDENARDGFSDMSNIDLLVYRIIWQIKNWRDKVFEDCEHYQENVPDKDCT
jgi:hypothetical protein